MKQLLILSFLFFNLPLYSQDWLDDTEKLKGQVKSVHYKSTIFTSDNEDDWLTDDNNYSYNSNGFLIKSVLSSSMGGSEYISLYRIYNQKENRCLVESEFFGGDSSKRIFEYNNLGKVEKVIFYSSGVHWSTFNYVYEKTGLVRECYAVIQRNNDTIRNIYEYDESGRKIKDAHLSSDYIVIKTWIYNENGDLIEEKSEIKKSGNTIIYTINTDGTTDEKIIEGINPDDDENYIINYTYNNNHQITREVKRYLDNRLQHDISFIYSENGEIDTEYHLNLKNDEQSKLCYKYEFDSNGNWILKTSYWNDELDRKEEREITYY